MKASRSKISYRGSVLLLLFLLNILAILPDIETWYTAVVTLCGLELRRSKAACPCCKKGLAVKGGKQNNGQEPGKKAPNSQLLSYASFWIDFDIT